MLIKACLNGARDRHEHLALPITPQEMAQAAREAVAAGAGALHFHPRDAAGAQSLDGADVAAAVAAVRDACPGVPLGVTTVDVIEPNVARRVALLRGWTTQPDFASVNFGEAGAAAICEALWEQGVGVEAGLANVADVTLLLVLGLAPRCVRLLLEPDEQDAADALATVQAMNALLDAAGVQTPRLLHGFEVTAWPLLRAAFERGYDTRIGFEDTLHMPDGSRAASNADLVAAAVALTSPAK